MFGEHTPEDLALFVSETEELLNLLEEALIGVERHGVALDTIQHMFRAAHTLKGSSATAGFGDMAQVTHFLEDVLALARDQQIELDIEAVDTLLECVDWLRLAKQRIEQHQTLPDPRCITDKLKRIGETGHAPCSYLIDVELTEDAVMPSVRMFQILCLLQEHTTLIRSEPSMAQVRENTGIYRLKAWVETSKVLDTLENQIGEMPDVKTVSISNSPVACGSGDLADRTDVIDAATSARRLSQTVRVDVSVIDNLMNLTGELIIDRGRLTQLISELQDTKGAESIVANLALTAGHLARVTSEIQDGVMRARLMPLSSLLRKYPRMLRDLAVLSGKQVELTTSGENTELDRSVIEALDDPLIHLLRNSIDHGIEPPNERISLGKPETGCISISAMQRENHVVLEVSDDGRGIDPEKIRTAALNRGIITAEAARNMTDEQSLELILIPGFSTASKVSETSGRGVGLDVVSSNLKKINGALEVRSQIGRGTKFVMSLPLTLAIVRALIVRSMDEVYALPVSSVREVIDLSSSCMRHVRSQPVILCRDETLPLFHLHSVLRTASAVQPTVPKFAVIVSIGGRNVAFGVDSLVSEQEVVVKALGSLLESTVGVSGTTILGHGDVAVIVDPHALVNHIGRAHTA